METRIGERMKSLRVERGMTLAELAEQVNLSTSYLSQIERDRTMPSLSTLVDIAQGLKVEPRYFFESGDDTILVRRARETIQPDLSNPEMRRYALSAEGANNTLRVYQVELLPNSGVLEFDPYTGEEMCFVISGEVTMNVGDETHTLRAGDSIHYDALLPHSWSHEINQACVLIWSRASYT